MLPCIFACASWKLGRDNLPRIARHFKNLQESPDIVFGPLVRTLAIKQLLWDAGLKFVKGSGPHDIQYTLPLVSASGSQLLMQSIFPSESSLSTCDLRSDFQVWRMRTSFFLSLGLEDKVIFHDSRASSRTRIVQSLESISAAWVRGLTMISNYAHILKAAGSQLDAIHVERDFTEPNGFLFVVQSRNTVQVLRKSLSQVCLILLIYTLLC